MPYSFSLIKVTIISHVLLYLPGDKVFSSSGANLWAENLSSYPIYTKCHGFLNFRVISQEGCSPLLQFVHAWIIFQTEQFSAVKFFMGHKKNTSILILSNLKKIP